MDSPLALNRASQKLTAVAILLRAMPEPSMPKGRNMHEEARALIEAAAVQQAENSASCMCPAASARASGTTRQDHEASVHILPEGRNKAVVIHPSAGAKVPLVHDRVKLPPVKERIRDTRGHADDGDARNVLNKKK